MAWVLDLDGVVWLADQPIDGSADAVARIRAAGEPVAFVTNNSYATTADVAAKLGRMGIDAGNDVITSATAAATLLHEGETVLVCGGPGVEEAIRSRGCTVTFDGDADAVMVGYDPAFDYSSMSAASTAVRRGARLIATNDDATYPTPHGPVPGGGAILASVVTASGVQPLIAGKPHEAMCELVWARFGHTGIAVGDRPETDGRFARALGYRFGLVLSGVTRPADLPVEPEPEVVADDLSALVGRILS